MEQRLHELVVGFDFSEASYAALGAAVFLARRIGSRVRVVTALPNAFDDDVLRTIRRQAAAQNAPMRGLADQLSRIEEMVASEVASLGVDDVPIAYEIGRQSAVKTLLRAAHDHDGDMVLVGNIGARGRTGTWTLGVDALRLTRRSPRPVLVVNPARAFPPQRILCAVDFSEASERAFGWAVDLARLTGAQVSVLHVIEDQPPLFARLSGVDPAAWMENIAEIAQDKLDGLVALHRADFAVGTKTRVGLSDLEILAELSEGGHDLLAIGSVGRSAIVENLVGGTAERVMRECRCSILAAKPDSYHVRTGFRSGSGTGTRATKLAV